MPAFLRCLFSGVGGCDGELVEGAKAELVLK